MSRSFTFFQSFADAANMMNDTDRLAFYDAIVGCAIYGEETDALPPAAHLVFTAIKPILEANVRDRDNGSKGGRPKTENPSENPQKNPSKNPTPKPKVKYSNVEYSIVEESSKKSNIKESGQAATATKFIPPTLEEVKAFIQEKGYKVNALKFYSYYSSNGWKVGKNPMKSWKQAVVSWNCDAVKEAQSVRKVDNIHNIGDFSNERTTI